MATKAIPDSVKEEVVAIIDRFNSDELGGSGCSYIPRWKGKFLDLDLKDGDILGKICRLRYNGDMKGWEFAIFKYSTERYDPEECFFPGAEFVNGTIEGAMMAGLEAYSF